MLKLVDRYIFKELFDPFIFGLLSFSLILSASMVMFELVRAVVISGMPILIALKIFIFRLPAVVVYIFPMATLLAALLGFSRLSKDSEITAFRASGVSLSRLMYPVIIFGLLISVVNFLFYEIVVPESNKAAKNLLIVTALEKAPRIEENVFVPEFQDGVLKRVFFAKKLENQAMKGVIVQEFSNGTLSKIINAKEALWLDKEKTWRFFDGIIYLLSSDGEYKHLVRFDEQSIAIKFSPADLYRDERKPEEMSIASLRRYIGLKEKMGEKVTSLQIQLNMKIAIPFASLVFVLLGAPLGLSPRRASSSVGLGLSIIVIFAYYVLMFFSMALGELGLISPPLAAWLPNIITALISYRFIRQAGLA
ncbi:MAG: YjgP/YjgQ family permease [Candidatus Saganbacteria bacterium]|nr:YjgP/YjgQ family permease [Candidatus Saganbacteria bacterium]